MAISKSNPVQSIARENRIPDWVAYCIADFLLCQLQGRQSSPTWHVLAMAELTRIVGDWTDKTVPSLPIESATEARARIIDKVIKQLDDAIRQQRGMEARHGKAPQPAA